MENELAQPPQASLELSPPVDRKQKVGRFVIGAVEGLAISAIGQGILEGAVVAVSDQSTGMSVGYRAVLAVGMATISGFTNTRNRIGQ